MKIIYIPVDIVILRCRFMTTAFYIKHSHYNLVNMGVSYMSVMRVYSLRDPLKGMSRCT